MDTLLWLEVESLVAKGLGGNGGGVCASKAGEAGVATDVVDALSFPFMAIRAFDAN